MNPLISIIIPVFNVEEYLRKCIESVINQSISNFELILIDDGSEDNSGYICDEFASLDNRIKVIHNTNKGVSYARNCGLDIAKGKYICFGDSDDIFSEFFLEKMVKTIENLHCDMVICGYFYKKENYSKDIFKRGNSRFISKEELCERIFLNNEIGGFVWNKLIKADIAKKIRFNEGLEICEDTYYLMNMLPQINNIYYICEPLYHYLIRKDSAVNKIENLITNGNKSKYNEVFWKIINENNVSDKIKKYIKCNIFALSVSLKCDYINLNGKNKKIINNLNNDAMNTLSVYLLCKLIPLNKKIITILNYLFNIRKLKGNFK